MSSSRSSRERSKKGYSKGEILGFDLLYQLTHLSALAAAGIPRNQMFRRASELPCSTSGYFHDIDRLAETMNYQYAEACRVVGESAKEQEVKSLLLRLSGSLSTGEPAAEFFNREANIQAEAYGNCYEDKLESLKKWADAYIALMVSVALIIVVAAISTVIYDMGTGFVTGLALVMIVISAMGCWVIYRTAPREVKTLGDPQGMYSQRLPRKMFTMLVPAALVIGALMVMVKVPIGLVLAAIGVVLLPIGIVASRLDKKVDDRDNDVSAFLRVLGATATAIGTTPTEALGRMDLRAIGSLAGSAKRLYTMLRARISPELCWNRFVTETGSELINRSSRIFVEGVTLGGEAEEVGTQASEMTMKVNFLRAKRKLVASSFGWLALIMHATIVFLLVFIIEIVNSFGTMVQSAGVAGLASGNGAAASSVMSFNFQNISFLRMLMIPVVIILSVINAITPKVTDGGYSHKFFFYLGATLVAAGLSLDAAPKLTHMLFNLTPIS